MRLSFVLSAILCFVALRMQACNGCLEKERVGLLEIKAYFIALGSTDAKSELLRSWVEDRASNCCAWERVKCSNISSGHVIDLSLGRLTDYSRRSWMFNVSLFRPFEELLSLDLSFNSFESWINNEVFPRLKKLEILDMSYNELHGSILQSLNGLTSLRTLNLDSNHINDSFLDQGFSRLKKLEILDLSFNSLNSSILPSFSGLTSLSTLKLGGNLMNDSLSAQDFQNLKSLKALDLSGSLFGGTIQGLCNMKGLVELDLSYNRLTGQLPECLGNLTNLYTLDLSYNLFTGNFPSFISNLTSLGYLSLLENYFQGSFSLNTLANHSKLQVLFISSQSPQAQVETENTRWLPAFQLKSLIIRSCNLNRDQGSVIPSFLLYQYDLQSTDLSHNKMVGEFPNWLIYNNSGMELLSLRNNSFVGNLKSFSFTKGIQFLDISNNNLSGLLPKDIGTFLPIINDLNISMNNYEGNIPASIGEMGELLFLDLSHNHFSGELPEHLGTNWTPLQLLKLSNNFLHGNIPRLSKCTNLFALYLNNNKFNGTLKEVLSNIQTLSVLDISNNSISGAIPSSIGKFSSMNILRMAENQLEGEIPFGISNMTQLEMLDLSRNRLFGSVPNFNTSSLKFLYLQKNALSGSIPFSLSKSSQLVTLDLRDNKFSGYIPYWIDKLLELRVLLLGGNNLGGHIPIQLCQLKNITIMDLSRNVINGSIPSCFKNLSFGMLRDDDHVPNFELPMIYLGYNEYNFSFATNLSLSYPHILPSFEDEELAVVEFRTKGNYYSYQGKILEMMSGLDLSCNKLTGIIPSQIGNWRQIRALNLSHNYLSGSIPKTFSNLNQIESLDLSFNNLSGHIPSELIHLNFLSAFNVSYNNLSGIPPSTGVFAIFDENNYRSNPSLCGPLLQHKCEGAPPSQSNNTKEKEAAVDMVAFYWSFIASYITILLGFITLLCINPYWRVAWFYFIGKVIRKCFPSFPLY